MFQIVPNNDGVEGSFDGEGSKTVIPKRWSSHSSSIYAAVTDEKQTNMRTRTEQENEDDVNILRLGRIYNIAVRMFLFYVFYVVTLDLIMC